MTSTARTGLRGTLQAPPWCANGALAAGADLRVAP
jgi:hypothetical protein